MLIIDGENDKEAPTIVILISASRDTVSVLFIYFPTTEINISLTKLCIENYNMRKPVIIRHIVVL